jgi:hypothetical protein
MCASEFGVRGFVVRVNHDIPCADFPIGKSPTGTESVDTLTRRVSGVLSSTRTLHTGFVKTRNLISRKRLLGDQ